MESKKKSPLTKRNRIVSWWLRFEDLNWPNHDGYERIKRRAEATAKANATAAMIFGAHFRWDFLPYFTLLHDYLATVAEELGKYGVSLYDHHSVNLIHRYGTREEMRHVMLHSGPHLPFSPSWEAAASWEFNGSRLNDWRMIDVDTRKVLWYPQYAAEGFCIRNPDFIEAYKEYVKRLIAETGIKGLSADDPIHYMHYRSCACEHCKRELKRRTGVDLPPLADRGFWGNWDNPAWHEWIDMRFDAARDFFAALKPVFPEDFCVTTCGINSAADKANSMGSDARSFLSGCNLVNLEMSGNTPPYKHDPKTANTPVIERLIGSSHHQAAAREKGVRCFATGFAFTEATANIVWAVNKTLDSDCWLSTLKDRLGLPEHILKSLPDETDIAGRAFGFEKEHPSLFEGKQVGQLGVYFSYETRKHSFFGNTAKGYYADYRETLRLLFRHGISPHTVFSFPEDAEEYPLILVPSPAVMTREEQEALDAYLRKGGRAIVTGPAAHPLCVHAWVLPSRPTLENAADFINQDMSRPQYPGDWMVKTEMPPYTGDASWKEPVSGLYYHPCRTSNGGIAEELLRLVRRYARPLPIKVIDATGYLVTVFESEHAVTVHLLAEDYDTDIDHELDEMRFHRSRVNFVNKAEPIGITDTVRLRADTLPAVYTPFNDEKSEVCKREGEIKSLTNFAKRTTIRDVRKQDGEICIRLPEKTAYAILEFLK